MRMIRSALVALLLPAALGAQAAASTATAARAALVRRIDSLVQAHLLAGPAASAAVAVVRGSDTILMRGYGYADIAKQRPAGPTTMYEIGSITKQFTSAGIMRL